MAPPPFLIDAAAMASYGAFVAVQLLGILALLRCVFGSSWAVLRRSLVPCCRRQPWRKGEWAVVTGATDVRGEARAGRTVAGTRASRRVSTHALSLPRRASARPTRRSS